MSCAVDPFAESDVIGRWRRTILRDGDRVGMVLVLGETRDIEDRRVVQLVCDCGRQFELTNGCVMQRARGSSVPVACNECSAQMREARADRRQSVREEQLLAMWKQHGTLYMDTSWIEADILDELENKIAPVDRAPKHLGEPLDSEEAAYTPDLQQRMANLFPIGGDDTDSCWKCVHCGAFPSRCFGCVECGETACVECVRNELHKHSDKDESTLEEVGFAFECHRERARQIESSALRKLRMPKRIGSLRVFATGDFTQWEQTMVQVAQGKIDPMFLDFWKEDQ